MGSPVLPGFRPKAMGAAAVTADVAGICVPLAVGSAVGSSCAAWKECSSQRVCVMDRLALPSIRCSSAACTAAEELPFPVMGVVHEVQVVKGVVGTFMDNEPVIGVRARTLPYTQAIGQIATDQEPAPMQAGHDGKEREKQPLGSTLPVRRYTFGDFLFLLPGMLMQDEVVVAFGTRTVVRLPFLGASNAPLDFDILGTVSMPLGRLLQTSQPVQVAVPIHPRGESFPQVAQVVVTFNVAPHRLARSQAAALAADDTDAVEVEPCRPLGAVRLLGQEGPRPNSGQGASPAGAHQFNVV